jgi:glycosyltransferase involved in cell wall biosynthesis
MRIGIDARGIGPALDGIGRYSRNLIAALAAIDERHDYVLLSRQTRYASTPWGGNFHEVPWDVPPLSLRTALWLPWRLRGQEVQVFHSLFFIAPLYGRPPLVVTVHDLMALTFPRFFSGRNVVLEQAASWFHRLFVPLSVKRAARVVAVSQHTAKDVQKYLDVPSERITVTYEAPEERFHPIPDRNQLAQFRQRLGLPEEFVLYVGNTKPYKNVPRLVEAFGWMKKKAPNTLKLVIAGKEDRFRPQVCQKVAELGLQEHVMFLSHLSDVELPLLLNCAKVFVFPSLYEGFGLPVMEAMACGTPVVTSTAASLPEVAGEAALLVDPLDVESIAEAINQALADEGLREELQWRGLERSALFSWPQTARQTLAVYEEVCRE